MNIKSYRWTTPFFSFLLGYALLHIILTPHPIETPQLLGKNISDALHISSSKNLYLRVIHEKEDKDLQEGIVISQTPQEGQKIKPGQHIFIVISKKPPQTELPSIVGLCVEAAQKKTEPLGIVNKQIKFPSHYPNNTIIAQIPSAHEFVSDNKMISYVSCNQDKRVIFPDLTNKTVQDVQEFLQLYEIKPKIYHKKTIDQKHSCTQCKVAQQRPLSGSIVQLSEKLSVYLEV